MNIEILLKSIITNRRIINDSNNDIYRNKKKKEKEADFHALLQLLQTLTKYNTIQKKYIYINIQIDALE